MKKLTALILAIALCSGLCFFAVSAADGDLIYGDVNGEGTVNSLDAAQILKLDAQLISLSEEALAAADVSGDGVVNSLDAAQVLKYDAQLISGFPAEGVFDEPIDEETSVETSEAISEKTSEDVSSGDVAVGDYITFGSYEQDNDLSNGNEAIEWLVLDVVDGKALVITRCGLSLESYHYEAYATWETCALRRWLNGFFYSDAFSAEEQAKILTVTVTNGNTDVDPAAGNDTQDKLFLLSVDEAEMYLTTDEARECYSTEYAFFNTALPWWLRTIVRYQDGISYAAQMQRSGLMEVSYLPSVRQGMVIARPAMWISID